MDPFSITAGCVGLVGAITAASISITSFISVVRSSRVDLDGISRELLSLKTILELLEQDLSDERGNMQLPESLQKQIPGIILNCSLVVGDIQEVVTKHDDNKLRRKVQWATSDKKDVDKLRSSLEAHKSALGLALEMIQL